MPNTSGIGGVVAYDTTGWPAASRNGPAARALRHNHVSGPVHYSVTPPVGGDHNATWMNCGIYTRPVRHRTAVSLLHRGKHVAPAWQQLKDLTADLIATGAQASDGPPRTRASDPARSA